MFLSRESHNYLFCIRCSTIHSYILSLVWDTYIQPQQHPIYKTLSDIYSYNVLCLICFRFSWNHISPSSLNYKNAVLQNEYGTSLTPWFKKRITHKEGWMIVLMADHYYNFTFENGEHLTNISYDSGFYRLNVSRKKNYQNIIHGLSKVIT